MKLWQLKKLSTNETLNEPQKLPENWGPIFGLEGISKKLNDLSWLGKEYVDLGWFVVGEESSVSPTVVEVPVINSTEQVLANAKELLRQSDWAMLPDEPMTKDQKIKWMDYRKALREISLQRGFPDSVIWPALPN